MLSSVNLDVINNHHLHPADLPPLSTNITLPQITNYSSDNCTDGVIG